jgi:hypothetical protein
MAGWIVRGSHRAIGWSDKRGPNIIAAGDQQPHGEIGAVPVPKNHRPPALDEVRQALDCIVRDAYRTSDVIYRIRGLLNEAPPKKERVEINGAIRDVLELTRDVTKNGV